MSEVMDKILSKDRELLTCLRNGKETIRMTDVPRNACRWWEGGQWPGQHARALPFLFTAAWPENGRISANGDRPRVVRTPHTSPRLKDPFQGWKASGLCGTGDPHPKGHY